MATSVQEQNLKGIADAIREKEGSADPIPASDFPDRIKAIQTGVDTSDATAAANDIASGKTAYVNGEKVEGVVTVRASGTWGWGDAIPTKFQNGIGLKRSLADSQSYIFRPEADIFLRCDDSEWGDATPADVARGKTFTSSSGVKAAGSVYVVNSGDRGSGNSTSSIERIDANNFAARGISSMNVLFKTGAIKEITFAGDYFGNATAADVAAGKTFTSAAGVKVVGTKKQEAICRLKYSNTSASHVYILYATKNGYGHVITDPKSYNESNIAIMIPSIMVIDYSGETTIDAHGEVDLFCYSPTAYYVTGDFTLTIT